MNAPDSGANETRTNEAELSALDGANPLGFLAALGTLVTLHDIGEKNARLRWRRARTWVPVIGGLSRTAPEAIGELIARGLRGHPVSRDAEKEREKRQQDFESARKAAQKKQKEIRARGVKGKDRGEAPKREVRPLEQNQEETRRAWLAALAAAVPRRELALGKCIDCTEDEFRQHADAFRAGAGHSDRDAIDLLAAFGSDGCRQERGNAIEPTPFQFITGSGRQFFLETVLQLIEKVSAERVRSALFDAWTYSDERLSMRWDPIEDKRYALLDSDPGPAGARTVWMANLLAYRSLVLFPSAPRNWGLGVTAWTGRQDDSALTWPIWTFPASLDVIRSLLQLRELTAEEPDGSTLRERGIVAAFRARRITVGKGINRKLNFSPARAV